MRWEYRFVEFIPDNTVYYVSKVDDIPYKGEKNQSRMANFCKQQGLEGWEIADLVVFSSQGFLARLVVFKRPLQELNPPVNPWAQPKPYDQF